MAKVKGAVHYSTKTVQCLAEGGPVYKTERTPSGAQQWTRGKDVDGKLETLRKQTDAAFDRKDYKVAAPLIASASDALRTESRQLDAKYKSGKAARKLGVKLAKGGR